jgi:hypothetical protein
MSDTDTTDVDRTAVRRTIRETIQAAAEPPSQSDLVDTVARLAGVPETAVRDELDACERHGFVYCVGDDDPEVKLP